MEVKINNQVVEAESGELLLQVALRNGIDIPHFCYHPCLSVAGNCRICLVKVEGQPKLQPSCNLAVVEGMEVSTDCTEVQEARRDVLQFILNDHPVDCGICDKAGECRLQDYQSRYGEPEPLSLEKKHSKPKFYDLSPRILLDSERCILCSRCVRFTHEISGSKQLGIVERGHDARVERLDDKPFDDPYSDNVIANCPVGALLSRDFLYQSRVWYLEPIHSACTGCSRCCSVQVWKRKDEWRVSGLDADLNRKAYRITAAENAEINGHWLCNTGFDLHKQTGRERAITPLVIGISESVDAVIKKARKLLEEAKNPAVIASDFASNEELLVLKESLGDRLTVYNSDNHGAEDNGGVQDDFLMRADKTPNRKGVTDVFGSRSFDARGGHDLVIVWGDNVDSDDFGPARIIRLASFRAEINTSAKVFIPVSTTFERSGSFTNFTGVESRFELVFEKPATVLHAADFFRRLAE
jgi:NADH-quinone oxidoreductase subunit G